MANLTVAQETLAKMAISQREAAVTAEEAAKVTTNLKKKTEITWGPLWTRIIDAVATVEDQRNKAIHSISDTCSDNAEILRTAAHLYTSHDTHLAGALAIKIESYC